MPTGKRSQGDLRVEATDSGNTKRARKLVRDLLHTFREGESNRAGARRARGAGRAGGRAVAAQVGGAVSERNSPPECPMRTNTEHHAVQFRAAGWGASWVRKPHGDSALCVAS